MSNIREQVVIMIMREAESLENGRAIGIQRACRNVGIGYTSFWRWYRCKGNPSAAQIDRVFRYFSSRKS